MDADQRLIALKRAYADIILNTSKEAAARVVASEKKAVRLEKELNDSKEQALQMLLRLKKMMDCKVMEAEMANFNQQRIIQELNGQLRDAAETICKAEATSLSQNEKIEELEAQLNEAEDIVKDLREELKEANTILEKVRKNKPQSNETFVTPTNETEVHIGNLNPIPEEETQETSQPIISPLLPISHKKSPSMTCSRNGNLNGRKAFIPSILLKSKGPEFCGNRRTQRIRAFEEKLMAGELAFTDTTYNVETSYERNVKEGGEGDTFPVEKKVPKVGRKFKRCKKKLSSTKDLYNRSRKIEDSYNHLSEDEPSDTPPKIVSDTECKALLEHEKVGETDQKFIENENLVSMDVEKVDGPSVTNEKVTPGMAREIDDQPVAERVFKYTFQRKRKREALSSSDGGLKKSTVEISNCPQEKEKCGSIVESSRDSRRLALVAHQLISLSEKKW